MNSDRLKSLEMQLAHIQQQINSEKATEVQQQIKTIPDDAELNAGVDRLHQLANEYDDLIVSARCKYLEFLAELQKVDGRYQLVGNHRRSLLHSHLYQQSDRAFEQTPYLRSNQDRTLMAVDLRIQLPLLQREEAIRRATNAG